MSSTPEWITSQRIARSECITCGTETDHQVQCGECWDKIHGER